MKNVETLLQIVEKLIKTLKIILNLQYCYRAIRDKIE
jgi:hypothetical protein